MANPLQQLQQLLSGGGGAGIQMPSVARSAMVEQLLSQAVNQPIQAKSPIEGINIASKQILAALLARREQKAQQTQAQQQQQALAAALGVGNLGNANAQGIQGAGIAPQPGGVRAPGAGVPAGMGGGSPQQQALAALIGGMDPQGVQGSLQTLMQQRLTPQDSWTDLTAQERRAAGVPEGSFAQRNSRTGEVKIDDPPVVSGNGANRRVQSIRPGENGNYHRFFSDGTQEDTGIAYSTNIRWVQTETGEYVPVSTSSAEQPSGVNTPSENSLPGREQSLADRGAAAQAGAAGTTGIENIGALRGEAFDARDNVNTIREAHGFLEAGIRTGTAAGFRQSAGRMLDTLLGRPTDEQQLNTNTDAYVATAGRMVGQMITLFGAGTGLSDADREYAAKIAGGNIEITEDALRELLRIQSESAFRAMQNYNESLSGVDPSITGLARFSPVEFSSPYEGFVAPGTIEADDDGVRYRYKGGGPQNRASWERVE